MQTKPTYQYFYGSFLFTFIGLAIAAYLGWIFTGTNQGILNTLFIVIVLSILEVSLSFDNAVVNAIVLKDMDEVWRRRFLTWGILIAVFGMRLVFPVAIVAFIAQVSPWEAVVMAARRPEEYAQVMLSAHVAVAAYGGAFLMMVALKYFFDLKKDVHWLEPIEQPLSRLGKIEAIEIGLILVLLLVLAQRFEPAEAQTLVISGVWGIITYIIVDAIGAILSTPEKEKEVMARSGLASFIYLEVLDSSFSFDGVVGAFAITNNLFIIMIGLGIGALFVRSLTILFVDKGTVAQFRYLEHGAFWAIFLLASIMFINTFYHVNEVITGVIGAVFIGFSLWSSVRFNRINAAGQ